MPSLELLKMRSQLLWAIRSWFLDQGFIEVDVPITSDEVVPEEHIRPFRLCQKNGRAGPFLLPSPEIHIKPLLSTGAKKIFTITKAFRQDECGQLHLPEFTMLEWYRAGSDYRQLMGDCQGLILHVMDALGRDEIQFKGESYRPAPPFAVKTISELFIRHAGWDPLKEEDRDRFDLDMMERIEPVLSTFPAIFVMDFPAWQASLSRLDPSGRYAERVELYLAGVELANGFSELMDKKEQREKFIEEIERAAGRLPADSLPAVPEKFLEGLGRCPKQACGMALGIDRLFILILDIEEIDKCLPIAPVWLC